MLKRNNPLVKLKVALLGVWLQFSILWAWLGLILTLPFATWDAEESTPRNAEGIPLKRGDLPKNWLGKMLQTPDERLPGDSCEKALKDIYLKYGKYIASFYWLGIRNTGMGAAVALGHKTTDYIPELPLGNWERGDPATEDYTWRYSSMIGKYKFVVGHQVYKSVNGDFLAAPVFTIKRP